jgi:hypothetical protein
MKSWFWKGMLAAAIVLPALSGAAWAGGDDDLGCSNATLKGDYAFSVFNGAPGPQAPWVVGLGTFDGKTAKDGTGGFTQIDYPGDGLLMTPPLTAFRTGETGTYMVNRNCTGFMTIDLGGGVEIVNAIVISNGGRSIDAVVAGFTVGGTPVPGQALVHFSKVASERDN